MAQPFLDILRAPRSISDFTREKEEFDARKQAALLEQQLTQAKIVSENAGGSRPAALQIADAYAKARADGDTQRMNDIAIAAKSFDRGVVYDQSGNPVAMGGYGDAVGAIAGTKKAYEAQAQNMSDLQYDPQIAGQEAQARFRQQAAYEPVIQAANKEATLRAESQTQADLNYPKVQEQGRQILDVIKGIEESPGLSAVVGMPNPMQGQIPFIGQVPGTPAADFQAKLNQLGGKQFLEAFESLKGGGQITQIEGEKATNAIARMQTSQSEAEFRKALSEFKDIVVRAQENAASKTGRQFTPNMLNTQNSPKNIGSLGQGANPAITTPVNQIKPILNFDGFKKGEIEFNLKKKGFTPEQIEAYKKARGL